MVLEVRDLRMRYGSARRAGRGHVPGARAARWSACSGPTAPARPRRSRSWRASGCARPARSACSASTRRAATRTGGRGSAWCCSPGATTREWTPRALLAHLGGYYAPYSTPGPAAAAGRRRADRDGRADRARGPEDRHAVRRAAPPPRRGHRHRRPARAAVPGRADGRLRPAGAARVPRPGAPAVGPGGHHDPAHHARPRRGREARRPHPHPGRRPDHRRRQRRRSWPGGSPARPRCAGSQAGERFVHSTEDATAFVRELLAQHGDDVADLEVRRASLEDTYMALVQQHEREPGQRAGTSVRGGDADGRRLERGLRLGLRRGWTEFVHSLRSAQDQGFYLFTGLSVLGYLVLPAQRDGRRAPTCSSSARARCPASSARLIAFGGRRRARRTCSPWSARTARCCAPRRSRTACSATSPASCSPTVSASSRSCSCILVPSFLLFDDVMAGGASGWLTLVWVLVLGHAGDDAARDGHRRRSSRARRRSAWGMLP